MCIPQFLTDVICCWPCMFTTLLATRTQATWETANPKRKLLRKRCLGVSEMPADANALHMIERCEKYEKFSLASLVVMNQRTWILLVGTVWYSTCFVLHFIASISSNPCLRKAKEWQRQIRGESRRIDRDVSRMRAFIAVE